MIKIPKRKKKPGKFDTFPDEVKEQALIIYGYTCALFGVVEKCKCKEGVSIHHKISNTVPNRVIYGKFLQSVYNAMPGCCYCHKPSEVLNAIRDETIKLYNEYKDEIEKKGYNDPELRKIFCFNKTKLDSIING